MSSPATITLHGASACLVDGQGRVLLIPREKEPFRDAFAFPGGAIERGEAALDAARRELAEETGFRVLGDPFAEVEVDIVAGDIRFHVTAFAFADWVAPEVASETKIVWRTFDEARRERLAPGMDRALAIFESAFAREKKVF